MKTTIYIIQFKTEKTWYDSDIEYTKLKKAKACLKRHSNSYHKYRILKRTISNVIIKVK